MKVHYTTENGRLKFEFEVSTNKEAFAQVAEIQEVFEEPCCGKCGVKQIRFEVREFDGNSYYKMVCESCSAQLDFGQNKDMKNLFPKWQDKDTKKPLPNRGWYIYGGDPEPRDSRQSEPVPPQQPPAKMAGPVINHEQRERLFGLLEKAGWPAPMFCHFAGTVIPDLPSRLFDLCVLCVQYDQKVNTPPGSDHGWRQRFMEKLLAWGPTVTSLMALNSEQINKGAELLRSAMAPKKPNGAA